MADTEVFCLDLLAPHPRHSPPSGSELRNAGSALVREAEVFFFKNVFPSVIICFSRKDQGPTKGSGMYKRGKT